MPSIAQTNYPLIRERILKRVWKELDITGLFKRARSLRPGEDPGYRVMLLTLLVIAFLSVANQLCRELAEVLVEKTKTVIGCFVRAVSLQLSKVTQSPLPMAYFIGALKGKRL